jgi:hypothetical protein
VGLNQKQQAALWGPSQGKTIWMMILDVE